MVIKKLSLFIFNIFQLPLKQYIVSLVLNVQAFLPNECNFIEICRKKKLKNWKLQTAQNKRKYFQHFIMYRKCLYEHSVNISSI